MKASLVTALALSAALIAPAAWAQDDGPVTVRYSTFNATAEIVGRVAEEKFCSTHHLKCEAVVIMSGPLVVQSLQGDSIQFGFVAGDVVIKAVAQGAAVQIVSGVVDRLPYQVAVRSGLERPNKAAGFPAMMKDFKGKKIGVTARGAATDLAFDLLLRSAGMSSSDVTYVAVGGAATAFGSLKSKQVDAAMVFQPMPSLCSNSGVCDIALDMPRGDGGPTLTALSGISGVYAAKAEYLEKHPDTAKAFFAAIQDAEKWVQDRGNFGELRAIAKKYIKLDVPNADAALDAGLKEMIGNTDSRIRLSGVQAYIDVLSQRKLIPRKVSVKKVVWSGAPVR
jgi:NitT/TauT family transport system substrate-binding protein